MTLAYWPKTLCVLLPGICMIPRRSERVATNKQHLGKCYAKNVQRQLVRAPSSNVIRYQMLNVYRGNGHI